ncbi:MULTISPECIES: beta-ketoacyl-ACP synthase II [Candidatus Ichthyocystis]|uniref:3-oxoacyl-[acyl-carrier-protein] synthase 2 n=1 Tax=Candidatus Ichthyocystis hellenicum TaxID=1561003 RepID=A0A0S4M3Q2_9BURK|nr:MULTISPECIES: beta-ketoacyl-ACP synthase II [Ichthyocystis]CUT17596.1 3-oxoacyl-ACP synthase [Candidatus Ichthyocystis hellenicum]
MPASGRRRVVITGMSLVTSLGSVVDDVWRLIVSGQSGVKRIESFDATSFPTSIAAEINDFSMEDCLSPKEARRMGLFMKYGVVAGVRAFRDASLDADSINLERCGVCMGSGIGGLREIEETCTNNPVVAGKCSPFFVPMTIINMISGHLSVLLGFQGPNTAVVTACATSTHAIGLAARQIANNEADIMIAGGSESTVTPLGIGGFCAMRALSTRNDVPEKASRPWDRDRDGFVLGEGAGAIVLEEYDHAVRRGSKIYCELSGFGMSDDACHMTAPREDGSCAANCMMFAMRDAGVNPDQVQYVNAHGTSTQIGDRAESRAIRLAFGDYAGKLMISSTKSMTGHLLGAAGAVEAIFTALTLHTGEVPPTINLDNPDECVDGLDLVPNEGRLCRDVSVAISNSFGFGGTNASLVMKKI